MALGVGRTSEGHRQRRIEGAIETAAREIGTRTGDGGLRVSRSLHRLVLSGGHGARRAADALHGTWLGHPLHPALTDFTIGALTSGAVFDGISLLSGDRSSRRAADLLIGLGTASALPTALAGLADYSAVPRHAAARATTHGLLNGAALGMYALSLNDRRRGKRRRGVMLSALALGTNLFSAWLGGHIVYRDRIGVDHSETFQGPQEWATVASSQEVSEGVPRRVEFGDGGVLLYRRRGQVHAIGAVCSHAAGPLEQGEFGSCTVQCPWHQSVFDLRDGSVVHGPATAPQPSFEVRERGSDIDIRLASRR